MSAEAERLCNEGLELISSLLEYRPELGGSCLVWKEDRGAQKVKGSKAGCRDKRYWRVGVKGKSLLAHHIVWFLTTGEWPKSQLDHKNGDRDDNRIENLRLAPRGQYDNMQNARRGKNNTSGYVGVDWRKAIGKWRARLKACGVSYELGYFNTPEEAYAAYLEAKKEHHKFQPVPREHHE